MLILNTILAFFCFTVGVVSLTIFDVLAFILRPRPVTGLQQKKTECVLPYVCFLAFGTGRILLLRVLTSSLRYLRLL